MNKQDHSIDTPEQQAMQASPRARGRWATLVLEQAWLWLGLPVRHHGVLVTAGWLLLLAVLLEVAPRFSWLPLPRPVEVALWDCFGAGPTAHTTQAFNQAVSLHLPKPNLDLICRANGRRWRHQSDAMGFRNPETWTSADIVLVGGSQVYGQGLPQEETLAQVLRGELAGRRVVNQGWVGATPAHLTAFVQQFSFRLKPQIVVLALTAADLKRDLVKGRSSEDLGVFLETGRAPETANITVEQLAAGWRAPARTRTRLCDWLLTCQMLRAVLTDGGRSPHLPAVSQETGPRRSSAEADSVAGAQERADTGQEADAATDGERADQDQAGASSDADELGEDEVRGGQDEVPAGQRWYPELGPPLWQAYVWNVLPTLVAGARQRGVTLVLALLPEPGAPEREGDVAMRGMLQQLSAWYNVPLVDLLPPLLADDGSAKPGTRWPRDGHLKAEGVRLMAGPLALFLQSYLRKSDRPR